MQRQKETILKMHNCCIPEKKTIRVITMGCSKNIVDTEHLLAHVKDYFEIVPEGDDRKVDYLLLNTCGFIGDAKEESIQAILEATCLKAGGKVGKILVFGCLSQRYMQDMPGLIPEVDGWFGARDLVPVVKALGCPVVPSRKFDRVRSDSRLPYAFLKISEGCDRRCSYCAIPFIRGPHRSVPIEDLVAEATKLAGSGVKELVLIAQDTTYYGLDLYHKRALAGLLEKLSDIEGIRRIRIHYSYPADFPEDVLDQMAGNPKVCRYMDIPLQHVSDKVLDMMHRHVDGAWTRELVRKMRERVPGIVLRTTMITGHPGEGESEFNELLDFVKDAKFERLGAFTYSEEEGTYGAEHYDDDVPENVKKERLDRLMEIQKEISASFNESRIGTEIAVLVDAVNDGILICRSEFESPEVDGEILVKYDAELMGIPAEDMPGRFINVRVTRADDYDLAADFLGFEQ